MGFESFGKTSVEKPKKKSGTLMKLVLAAMLAPNLAQAPGEFSTIRNKLFYSDTPYSENIEDRRSWPAIMHDLVSVTPAVAKQYPLNDFAHDFARQPATVLGMWRQRPVTMVGPVYDAGAWRANPPEGLRALAKEMPDEVQE